MCHNLDTGGRPAIEKRAGRSWVKILIRIFFISATAVPWTYAVQLASHSTRIPLLGRWVRHFVIPQGSFIVAAPHFTGMVVFSYTFCKRFSCHWPSKVAACQSLPRTGFPDQPLKRR